MKPKVIILPLIVFSQFCCTSLWFAGNGVILNLIETFNLEFSALGDLTSAVQFGFIFGTLIFALFTITDRFSPSKVFFYSAIIASLCNVLIIYKGHTFESLMGLRFMTGFFLAGIYPVGIKIASDYYKEGLGKSLGFLVGALVLGTAFPHLLKGSLNGILSWEKMIIVTSLLSLLGGLLIMLFVPNGPYRQRLNKFDITTCYKLFSGKRFKAAAFGYFGHMWELYAFWVFTPVLLMTYAEIHSDTNFNVPLVSFIIIGIGSLSCVISGYLSLKFQTKTVAGTSLFLSLLCCLLSPLFFQINSELVFILFLMFWSMVVIADSPLFSTLVAQNVDISSKGTAITIVNCIGFAITIVSIQVINVLIEYVNTTYVFTLLALGPILGLVYLMKETEQT
ncbi:MFS transporter [Algibacter mikhailovii]|uniref:MFS transporter n=1 Tax=Algibacter mikhailovii TaxID=425498 RepID=UPI002494B412|nr:MFS transporter [Algibacter mikhailovii]